MDRCTNTKFGKVQPKCRNICSNQKYSVSKINQLVSQKYRKRRWLTMNRLSFFQSVVEKLPSNRFPLSQGEGAANKGVHSVLQTVAASAHGMPQAGAAGPQAAMHAVKTATHAPMQEAQSNGPPSTAIGALTEDGTGRSATSKSNRKLTFILFGFIALVG